MPRRKVFYGFVHRSEEAIQVFGVEAGNEYIDVSHHFCCCDTREIEDAIAHVVHLPNSVPAAKLEQSSRDGGRDRPKLGFAGTEGGKSLAQFGGACFYSTF